MASKLVMLALSPTMEQGVIASWHKNEGDTIAVGEVICEVETDKATMDYESAADGVLLKIVTPKGSRVNVGELIAVAGTAGEDISALLAGSSKTPDAPATPTTPPQPPAPASPRPPVSAPPPASTTQPAVSTPAQTSADLHPGGSAVPASPLARQIAAERGIDINQMTGSGPGGRVVKRDVEKVTAAPISESPVPVPQSDTTVPVSEKRRIIADRLSKSFFTAPHYFLRNPVKADILIEARKRINASTESKLSLNAFIIKLTAAALHRHPAVNSSWNGNTITRHGAVHIALAVSLDDGLITPVVRNCDSKGIAQIDTELRDLIDRARKGRLTPPDYTGSTFTITNLGTFGVREFTAIINPPEAAILGVGEMFRQPVAADDGRIEIEQTMILTLSCDHRLLDGAVSAAFFADLKRMFENPMEALL